VRGEWFEKAWWAKVVILKPSDPEAKGLLERVHAHLERSLCPAHVQLVGGFEGSARRQAAAGQPASSLLGCLSIDRITADRAAILRCPPVPPSSGGRGATWFAWVSIFSNARRVLPSPRPGKRVDVEERAEREGALEALQAVGDAGRTGRPGCQ
jgi:hypothetical protein